MDKKVIKRVIDNLKYAKNKNLKEMGNGNEEAENWAECLELVTESLELLEGKKNLKEIEKAEQKAKEAYKNTPKAKPVMVQVSTLADIFGKDE